MGEAAEAAIDETLWQRLLDRSAKDAAAAPLFAPLLAPPTAPDGCFVIGRIAQSLDGKIATRAGDSFWIGGAGDLLHTHRLRALSDAVVIGAGTVIADDPLLTTRRCAGPSPMRVVLDTERRVPPHARVFEDGPPTLLLCAEDARGHGGCGAAEMVRLPRAESGNGLEVAAILAALAARGLRRVFVEGGGVTLSRWLAAGALDRLHVTVAPLLLGDGVPAFTLPCPTRLREAMRLRWTLYRLGEDLLLDIPLHRARPPCA
jgi:riboflavin-specific deaminase-like protein